MTENLFDAIHARGGDARERVLLEQPDGRAYRFGEALAFSARLASRLNRLGVRPGDRIAVQAEKCAEAVLLYLACLRAGAVYVPLNTDYTAPELCFFVDDAEPALVVCPDGDDVPLAEVARHAATRVETLGTGRDGTLLAAIDSESPLQPAVAAGPDTLAAILYTSGTTGRPKGAMLSHGNLLSNARALVEAWRFSDDDRLLHALPLFHTHGLFVACNVCMISGAGIVLLERFDIEAVLHWLPACTVMMGVPTFYTRLLDNPRFDARVTGNIRLLISGSAPLRAEDHEAVRARTGHAIVERYGMTETNMNTSNPWEGERRPGSVGFPLPGVDLRITDPETGAPVAEGEVGSLEVRGPNVFSGYWRMPEKTAEDFREDGFFITGDLARRDADGYLQIVGRQKDLVISGGYNVYPREVERIIDEVPPVLESAVFGVPHPDLGEGVTAVVVPREGREVDTGEILEALGRDLARYKHPRRILIVDTLPRNVMGKVQKNVLRSRYQELYRRGSPG